MASVTQATAAAAFTESTRTNTYAAIIVTRYGRHVVGKYDINCGE